MTEEEIVIARIRRNIDDAYEAYDSLIFGLITLLFIILCLCLLVGVWLL